MIRGTGKRARGSALVAVMMVIAMLMAVVLAISHFQAVARRTYMTEEANLRFREAARFETRRQVLNINPPGDLILSVKVKDETPAGTPKLSKEMASDIFNRSSSQLPDLRSVDKSPANQVLRFTPQSNDPGLLVFGSNTYTQLVTNVPGYAAYAPNGSVNITNLESWANPTFQDARKTLQAYSGVMAVVAAKQDANIANVTYGEAHVMEGTAKFDHGDGVGFKKKNFPLPAYEALLVQQAKDARQALINQAASGDKTQQLYSGDLSPQSVIDLFFNGQQGLEAMLSLNKSNHFFMPTIPFFSSAPPYLYSFAFHMPYPADNASYSPNENLNKQVEALNKQIKQAGEDLKKAYDVQQAAQQAYDQNKSSDNLQKLIDANTAYNLAKAKVDDLNQQMQALFGPQKAAMDAQIGSSQPRGVPLTRAQDPSGNDGVTGWSYASSGSLLGQLIKLIFTFDVEDLAKSFGNTEVKLVHFGTKEREFKFVLDGNNLGIDATMTVPRGRVLKLSGKNITISGDLWLQRGSTFYADCDKLTVVPGRGSDPSKYFSPCGRIFMEEGSTLICRGEVECLGSSDWGSVVVGGVPGKIHPITAAIFANKVTLGNGIFAGCALDDLAEGLGDLFNSSELKDLNSKLMRPLFTEVAPNAAKALGPFWPRKPYFAKYATTFQVICPPLPPFGEPGPPVPTAIPLPIKNVLVPIERALGYVYSVSLNLGLGENFYTHSDWWIFGEGVVPVVPQVDPNKILDKLNNLTGSIAGLHPEDIIKTFIEAAVKDMVSYVVAEVVEKIVAKVLAAAIPYAGLAEVATSLLDEATSNLTGRDTARDSAGQALTSALTDSLASAGKATLDKLASTVSMNLQDDFLREYNGLLVYADDTITVGGKNATGMFVAGGNLRVTSNQCTGTLLSVNGNIQCTSLLFYPYFNRASLYLPKETASGWLERGAQCFYDKDWDSKKAVDVGPPAIPPVVSAQGWAQ
ncbi:hypothetical protein JST97_00585 [bacterium]|nr:hypothetical protein [bacterium]